MTTTERTLTGTELAVRPSPLFRELSAFRERMGYGGPIVVSAGEAREQPVRRIALEQRLAEVRALLAAPGLPRPDDSFAAYALLVHLCFAVDGKYLGPCDLSRPLTERPICQPPEFFGSARSARAAIGVLPEFAFLLDPDRGVEIAQRTPGEPIPFEIALDDRFASLRQYAWRNARPFPASAIPSKPERMRQYFAFLGSAPAPEDRLQSYALVNWIFGAMEGRYRALPGANDASRMFTSLPFVVHQSESYPDADVLLGTAHATFYYADGSMEIHARDARRDVMDGARAIGIVLTQRECRLRGRPAQSQPSAA
jgi:hypothetical protein